MFKLEVSTLLKIMDFIFEKGEIYDQIKIDYFKSKNLISVTVMGYSIEINVYSFEGYFKNEFEKEDFSLNTVCLYITNFCEENNIENIDDEIIITFYPNDVEGYRLIND